VSGIRLKLFRLMENCAHIVNGVLVNYGENASVIDGKILLQSEYAEIYYRNVKIREF